MCIIWPPAANEGRLENIVRDYRDLFVTINSEPQRVSGHFLILLDDLRNSSLVVRELANSWKHEPAEGWSRLHLLEWNTRENERIDQRTRDFSVTTISIIAKALKDGLFDTRGLPWKALDLEGRAADFAAIDPDFQSMELVDDRPPAPLSKLVAEQIQARLVPALTTLFRQLRPYADLEAEVSAAFARLRAQADVPNHAYISLGQQLERFSYTIDDPAGGEVIGAYANFRQWARPLVGDESYFLAVFQQGLLRMWLQLLNLLDPATPAQTASAVVAALNVFAVRMGTNVDGAYLGPDLPYCRRVLWRGNGVNFSTEWAKKAWTNILLATFLRQDVRTAALHALSADPAVRNALEPTLIDQGVRAARTYANRMLEEIRRETANNLEEFFGEVGVAQMRELKRVNPPLFEARLRENSQPRYKTALDLLANRLDRRSEDLEFEPELRG